MAVTKLPSGKFYGRVIRSVDVPGFRLTESAYAAGAILPRHSHATAHFNLVVAGAYRERVERTQSMRRRSALLFLPGDCSHEEEHSIEGRHFMIELDDACLERFGCRPGDLGAPADLSGGDARRLAWRMYQEFSNTDDLSRLMLEGLALELLTFTMRRRKMAERKPPAWLLRVRERLETDFAQPFALADLARDAGIHPVHLAHAFRRWFGCTVGQFVRELRVNEACLALTRTDASLAEIALASGFADQSHLSRAFKRAKGMSPGAYKQKLRT